MGPRQSTPAEKETYKVEETNVNLGLVNVNEETFNLKRVTRTEIGIGILVLVRVLFRSESSSRSRKINSFIDSPKSLQR